MKPRGPDEHFKLPLLHNHSVNGLTKGGSECRTMQTGYQTKGQAFSSLLKLTAENNEGEKNSKVGLIEKRESRRVNIWKN